MLKQRHQLFVTLFGMVDATAVAGACVGAALARLAFFDEHWPDALGHWARFSLVLFAVPIAVATMIACRLYRPRRDRSPWGELWLVARAGLVSVATIVVALWAAGSSQLSAPPPARVPEILGWRLTDPARFQLGVLAVLIPTMVGAHRLGLRLVLRRLRRRGWNMRHVAIVGTGRLGQIAARTIARNRWTGIRVAYFVSHHAHAHRSRCLDLPVLGGLDDLDAVLDSDPVDAVYVALPGALGAEIPRLLRRMDRYAVDVRVIPDVQPRYLPENMSVSQLEGMPVLSYRESPLAGVGGVAKRTMDVAGALVALVVFAPLMAALAILVRLSGPGPVIFRQTRVSLGGEVFRIFKFRTMRHAGDEGDPARWTTRDDPRVTPVGRWLRRTSLDELPQLFNVLRGEMSLVGPRPERPELIDRFRDDWRGYMLRQQVKAGITGWAQIHGYRGDTSLRKRLQYDLFYIRNWSLWLDVRILIATLISGFMHRNAI